ncbi:MAG: hypothetical protein ABI477_19940 [Chryseolinea sp.]
MILKLFSGIALTVLVITCNAQTIIGRGEEPQMTLNPQNVVRLVYGNGDSICYAMSTDRGKTFSASTLVAEIPEMHLGMSRGPQIASSKDYSVITAIDKKGNIHTFRLTHKTSQWEKLGNINDSGRSAPEGLMSLAADKNNNFFAVWLDLRENHQNNICFSVLKQGKYWSKNKFVYKSPDGHVCECCKPSIVVNDTRVSIMFRNWLMGSRDLYIISSTDNGNKFSECTKLGSGTWHLNGCPMDGGGLTIDTENIIHTAWQREGNVYSCKPGKPEEKIGEGRDVGMSGTLVHWEEGSELFIKNGQQDPQKIGDGISLNVLHMADGTIIAAWENERRIMIRQL